MNINELKIWCDTNLYTSTGNFDGNKSTITWYNRHNYKTIYDAIIKFKDTNNLSKISEVAYWLKYNIVKKPTCLVCGTTLRFYGGSQGYSTICGKGSCRAHYNEQIMLETHGVTNYAKTIKFKDTMTLKRKEIEEKKKETCLKKYGVDNPMKNKEIKQKLENTMIDRFGVKTNLLCLSYESIEKSKNTRATNEFRNRLSIEAQIRHNSYSIEQKKILYNKGKETLATTFGSLENGYKEKYKRASKTFIKRYGVSNPQQCAIIHEKTQQNRYKFKEFKMPSGNIVKVQGYENIALKHIFDNGLYSEDQIELSRKEMPEIWYFDDNAIKRRYFPDIYVKSENKIIEVKSAYTMHDNLLININKKDASIKKGYSFEFWIFSKNGTLIIE